MLFFDFFAIFIIYDILLDFFVVFVYNIDSFILLFVFMKKHTNTVSGDPGIDSKEKVNTTKKVRFPKKKYIALLLSALLIFWNISKQKGVNAEHATLDYSFGLDDVPTVEALKYLVITPEYQSDFKKLLSRKWFNIDWSTDSYSVFVNLKDHKTIQDKKDAIAKLRDSYSRPVLISSDFEGWYVHAIDVLSIEEIQKYWIPQELIDLRNDEDGWRSKVSFFPSAEFLGKRYENIVLNWSFQERYNFLMLIKKYWECVRKIMEDIWVDIVFWPCADIVPDFDGDYPIAKNDRSFWESFIIWHDLISAFVDWFNGSGNEKIILVPKHYVWLWESTEDPHSKLCSFRVNKDGWSESIFRDLINWNNPQLDWDSNKKFIDSYRRSGKSDSKYFKILRKNEGFIKYLKNSWKSLSWWEKINAVMTTHSKWLWGLPETITYSDGIIKKLKNIWDMKNWLIFTDDLSMQWADEWLPKWFDDTDASKILLALSSWHDIVMDLWSNWNWWEILQEVADQIDAWFDKDGDGVSDLDRSDILKKLEKILNFFVEKWDLVREKSWSYRLNDATFYDPSVWKVIRDAIYSNQWPISWSWIDDYKKEWNWKKDFLSKKVKCLYEFFVHNWPNAIRKSRNQILDAILWNDDYEKALSEWKKLVIVDKSECKMRIFTLDWKKLLETHDVWVWKWSKNLDYKHDRRILWDDKTPVWYYMVVDRAIWWDELRENVDNIDRYWWENGWMLVLAWPWTPYVAIHGTKWDIWPSSNACVRVLDENERGESGNKVEQKAINHLDKILPDWTFVIITN